MSELSEYVKISTSTEGDCLVEVQLGLGPGIVTVYKETIDSLRHFGFTVANDKTNEIKATNDNTKFQPTVTVKGRGNQVVDTYVSELKRMTAQ
jgi:hypothetical protein